MYDESKKLTNFELLDKKPKVTELKTKYTKEFIEKNMKKDYDGLGEVRFKGKSKWGKDGYDEKVEKEDEAKEEGETEFKKLSKKKQQRLEEKSKKLLRVKKKKKKKQKDVEEIEGFGDQGDLLELAGKSGGWGGEGFTESKRDETREGGSNAKAQLNLPEGKIRKSKKTKKAKKEKKKKKKNKKKEKAKKKAQALFGGEANEPGPIPPKTEESTDKFSDLDLLTGGNIQSFSAQPTSTLVQPSDMEIEEYQEKWETLEDFHEEFKVNFDGSMKRFKSKIKSLGFAILDIQDSEVICVGVYEGSDVLMYLSLDPEDADGILASKNSRIASLVISALN